MVVDIDKDVNAKTPPYTPVVKRRLDASKLFDPLKRVDPARTVYTPPSVPPVSRSSQGEGAKKDGRA
jgi:hypothetical protein